MRRLKGRVGVSFGEVVVDLVEEGKAGHLENRFPPLHVEAAFQPCLGADQVPLVVVQVAVVVDAAEKCARRVHETLVGLLRAGEGDAVVRTEVGIEVELADGLGCAIGKTHGAAEQRPTIQGDSRITQGEVHRLRRHGRYRAQAGACHELPPESSYGHRFAPSNKFLPRRCGVRRAMLCEVTTADKMTCLHGKMPS